MAKGKSKFQMPPALIIVTIFLLFIAVLTWFVPTSVVVTKDNGEQKIVYNAAFDADGKVVKDAGTSPAGLWQIIKAPITGFQNGSDVIFAILIAGSFLGLLNYTGALDAGIGVLLKKTTGKKLLIVITLVFALMGTIFGTWEEIPVYAIAVIPLIVMAGYDVMTALAVLFVGATIGNMASVVNPFSTGAAISTIGNDKLSLGSGIVLRCVLFVVMYLIGMFIILRYAEKVKKDPAKSMLSNVDGVQDLVGSKDAKQMPPMTPARKWSLIIFIVMILLTVIGYIPWSQIQVGSRTMYDIINAPQTYLPAHVPFVGHLLGSSAFTNWGDWYFDEYSFVFLLGTIVVGFINHLKLEEFVNQVVSGARDLLGVCVVLAVAKGISVLMGTKTFGISVTFVYWIQNALKSVPAWAFVVACLLAYLLIGFFIQSTSSVAGITMTILGAVAGALFVKTAAIGEVGGQIMLVSCFTVGINFMSGIYPGATTMGTLDLVKVPYDKYLAFMMKATLPLLIVSGVIISIAPYLHLL